MNRYNTHTTSKMAQAKAIAGAVAVCIGAAIPIFANNYLLFQASMVWIYAICLFGLNMITGYAGQISFGHGAFFAIGAYAAAMLLEYTQLPYLLVIPMAGVICFVIGLIVAGPAMKLSGLYLGLATFAFAASLPQFLKVGWLEAWTGGTQGVLLPHIQAPDALPISDEVWLYCICVTWVFILLWVGRNLVRGRVGRGMIAIRDQPVAAEVMGIDTRYYKTVTFGYSVMYAGIAGALSALLTQFISPDSFPVFLSISLLVGLMVGGAGSMWGPFLGAVFILVVPNIAGEISDAAPWAIYGGILIACLYFFPGGVVGLTARIGALYHNRK